MIEISIWLFNLMVAFDAVGIIYLAMFIYCWWKR